MNDSPHGPRLTIGLPTYNGENYLAAALDDLLAQTYTDFELIISDNASTDDTGQIAQSYADQDPRIRYVRHPRIWVPRSITTTSSNRRAGEFFKWASDDDRYAPTLLQACMDALDARPEISLAHAWTAIIDDHGELTDRPDYPLVTDIPDPASDLAACST